MRVYLSSYALVCILRAFQKYWSLLNIYSKDVLNTPINAILIVLHLLSQLLKENWWLH